MRRGIGNTLDVVDMATSDFSFEFDLPDDYRPYEVVVRDDLIYIAGGQNNDVEDPLCSIFIYSAITFEPLTDDEKLYIYELPS